MRTLRSQPSWTTLPLCYFPTSPSFFFFQILVFFGFPAVVPSLFLTFYPDSSPSPFLASCFIQILTYQFFVYFVLIPLCPLPLEWILSCLWTHCYLTQRTLKGLSLALIVPTVQGYTIDFFPFFFVSIHCRAVLSLQQNWGECNESCPILSAHCHAHSPTLSTSPTRLVQLLKIGESTLAGGFFFFFFFFTFWATREAQEYWSG